MVNLADFGFKEEKTEDIIHTKIKTGWPATARAANDYELRFRLIYEIYNQSVEEMYFWTIDNLKDEEAFTRFDKILDVFAASEHSAFSGVAMQRLGLYQDKVSQFLATLGKMIKDLFQLVRELRIIDERMELYIKSDKGDEAAEISLKGYWIDLVEGGAKNPASVYGMSRELGFTTLPDLFFAAPPMASTRVDDYIASLKFNRKVKEVLSRKLKTYLVWKEHTSKELNTRRTFTLKYLRQHYDVIKMYMTWIKPYLRTIKRIQMDQSKMDTANLISAFENSMVEVEVLAMRPIKDGAAYAVMDVHFDYRSRPEMKYVQEGYQRGPVHVGRTVLTLRCYAWTMDEINQYKRYKAREDFELLSTIDASVQAAYTALGEELEKYLAEAGESFMTGGLGKKPNQKLSDPFSSIFKGFGDLGKAFGQSRSSIEIKCSSCGEKNSPKAFMCANCGKTLRKPSKKEAFIIKNARDEANEYCAYHLYNFVKRIKAAHGFVY